ncbi:MAG: hypothetical protein COB93_06295 [Sneathiella sp.]|nr:MAG: hypothetical protein COB93_06295 [Sneathiella sp.]
MTWIDIHTTTVIAFTNDLGRITKDFIRIKRWIVVPNFASGNQAMQIISLKRLEGADTREVPFLVRNTKPSAVGLIRFLIVKSGNKHGMIRRAFSKFREFFHVLFDFNSVAGVFKTGR